MYIFFLKNWRKTMIKSKDLRIGDFVKVIRDGYIIPKGTICKVAGIYVLYNGEGAAILRPHARGEEVSHIIRCKDIEGIPITKEFLIKNGFKETKQRRVALGYEWCTYEWYTYENKNSCVIVEYHSKMKEFVTFIEEVELCCITYIHELQNILSLFKENIEITV